LARTIKTNGTGEFKIICQPEYDGPQARSIIGINYRAYDVLPVPCRKNGTLQFDFEIDTDTDKMKLTIKHKSSGRGGRFTEVEAGRVRSLGPAWKPDPSDLGLQRGH
jgi:hypothetical protein